MNYKRARILTEVESFKVVSGNINDIMKFFTFYLKI
jgi:hypothetical protein